MFLPKTSNQHDVSGKAHVNLSSISYSIILPVRRYKKNKAYVVILLYGFELAG